jgi:hypothetical protein
MVCPMSEIPTHIKLSSGYLMPRIALGTFSHTNPDEVKKYCFVEFLS